jgi:hypothetical protein
LIGPISKYNKTGQDFHLQITPEPPNIKVFTIYRLNETKLVNIEYM